MSIYVHNKKQNNSITGERLEPKLLVTLTGRRRKVDCIEAQQATFSEGSAFLNPCFASVC